jgi:hypothetical protein
VPGSTLYRYHRHYAYPSRSFVRSWRILGPVAGAGGYVRPVQWRRYEAPAGYIDFAMLWGLDVFKTGYAACWVHADEPRQATIEIAGDDRLAVWLNQKLVLDDEAKGYILPAEQPHPISLLAGWNEILVAAKCGTDGWGFYLELLDPQGRPTPPGLRLRE